MSGGAGKKFTRSENRSGHAAVLHGPGGGERGRARRAEVSGGCVQGWQPGPRAWASASRPAEPPFGVVGAPCVCWHTGGGRHNGGGTGAQRGAGARGQHNGAPWTRPRGAPAPPPPARRSKARSRAHTHKKTHTQKHFGVATEERAPPNDDQPR